MAKVAAKRTKKLAFKNAKKSYITKDNKTRGIKFLTKKLKENEPEFFTLINRVSVRPKMKLCDITGLPANYTCPKTRLNYFDKDVYYHLLNMNTDTIKSVLVVKNFGMNLSTFK